MERTILTAAVATLLATPVAATPYQTFTDLRTRATVGTSVIRAFPNATTPTFRLLLERRSPEDCIVWLEFSRPELPIDHFGNYGKLATSNRRVLVQGPLLDDQSLDAQEINIAVSFLADQHWVARFPRGTSNDGLELISADVDLDANGACIAGVSTRFTPNLAYPDVVDSNLLTDFGEARLRGFPGLDPTFTLFLEFAEAGTTIHTASSGDVALPDDACILWLQFAERAFPFYTPSALNEPNIEDRIDVLGSVAGFGEGLVGILGLRLDQPLPWISRNTGEAFRLVQAFVSLSGSEGDRECEGRARVQFAPDISQFYR